MLAEPKVESNKLKIQVKTGISRLTVEEENSRMRLDAHSTNLWREPFEEFALAKYRCLAWLYNGLHHVHRLYLSIPVDWKWKE